MSEASIRAKRKYRETHREEINRKAREEHRKNPEARREYFRLRRINNPDLVHAIERKSRKKIASKIKAYKLAYRSDPENWSRELEMQRRRRAKNPEKTMAHARKYAMANPDKRIVWEAKRRAAKAGSHGSFSVGEIVDLYRKQRGRCAACKKHMPLSGKRKYRIDHVMPLVLGGSNDISNIQLLCDSCNSKKNKLHPDEWARRVGKLFV